MLAATYTKGSNQAGQKAGPADSIRAFPGSNIQTAATALGVDLKHAPKSLLRALRRSTQPTCPVKIHFPKVEEKAIDLSKANLREGPYPGFAEFRAGRHRIYIG